MPPQSHERFIDDEPGVIAGGASADQLGIVPPVGRRGTPEYAAYEALRDACVCDAERETLLLSTLHGLPFVPAAPGASTQAERHQRLDDLRRRLDIRSLRPGTA